MTNSIPHTGRFDQDNYPRGRSATPALGAARKIHSTMHPVSSQLPVTPPLSQNERARSPSRNGYGGRRGYNIPGPSTPQPTPPRGRSSTPSSYSSSMASVLTDGSSVQQRQRSSSRHSGYRGGRKGYNIPGPTTPPPPPQYSYTFEQERSRSPAHRGQRGHNSTPSSSPVPIVLSLRPGVPAQSSSEKVRAGSVDLGAGIKNHSTTSNGSLSHSRRDLASHNDERPSNAGYGLGRRGHHATSSVESRVHGLGIDMANAGHRHTGHQRCGSAGH